MPYEPFDLNSLRPNWTVEDIADVGRTIYRAVPGDQRPDWAGGILLYVAVDDFLFDPLARVVDISIDERRWIEAHDAFSAVRELTLKNEKSKHKDLHRQMVLDIGETAAKVIYNASGGLAPFDFHAGWRMAPRVRRLVNFVGERDFEEDCWHMLIRRRCD